MNQMSIIVQSIQNKNVKNNGITQYSYNIVVIVVM